MRADASTMRPPRERQLDAVDLAAGVDAGELGELDRALGGVLDRRVEDLAARHVRAAGVDHSLAALEADPEVGSGRDDAHLVAASNTSLIRPIRSRSASQSISTAP